MDQHTAPLRRLSGDWSSSRRIQDTPAPVLEPRSSSFRRTTRYDASSAMDRLRSTMVGDQKQPFGEVEEALSMGPESSFGSEESSRQTSRRKFPLHRIQRVAGQVPAIVLVGLFHAMISIPFGVSYFPIGWSGGSMSETDEDESDEISGPFPIRNKEALGIRMFLFSTMVGQVVFTLFSNFDNPIGLQMVENVPFCHALSNIVIRHQGYGVDSLSTLFVMWGMASIVVGAVFYTLGSLKLGRIVYYFPTHVLVGCIGGIGLYIAKTGIEVTLDAKLSVDALIQNFPLWRVVLLLEALLRVLERITRDEEGKAKYSLLSPIYFCMITPVFYAALCVLRIPVDDAMIAGYFFPSLQIEGGDDSALFLNPGLLDMWRVIDTSVVSWTAIVDSIPTLVALTLFSLIHVPINIPAFALSTNMEADMNNELVAHGYSNLLAGVLGGLQNYMAYTQSVVYDRAGGTGRASGLAVAAVTGLLFVVGPTVASFIPRCMAGTLLLHVGIDLFLEGVYDSYGRFDNLEYSGIWLITIVMSLYGMDAAMVAGVIVAISTFVVQNMAYVDPIRGHMSAATLRSNQLARSHKARAILDDPLIGRSRILVVQLQGNLYFGNMANLTESISQILKKERGPIEKPVVVILDFSLVLGIDSSAAQSMAKLKTVLKKEHDVQLSIFVSGSEDGFPCEFDLSRELSAPSISTNALKPINGETPTESTELLRLPHVSSSEATERLSFCGSHVCDSLNLALIYAENALIDREDHGLLEEDVIVSERDGLSPSSTLAEERAGALRFLENLSPRRVEQADLQTLFDAFEREEYLKDDFLWRQGSPSTCMKLLLHGKLIAMLEHEAGTSETIECGNTIGELGLVEGVPRMSSVFCISNNCVLYSLDKKAYENLAAASPRSARIVDLICVRYLSARVQHVSNRIFETRCLPI